MAELSIVVEATGYTTATAGGYFNGGATDYGYQRFVRLTIAGWGSTDIYSDQTSGGYNTFGAEITGLTAGTTYNWTAVLYYRTAGGWTASDYTDSGTFDTPAEEHTYYGYLTFDANGGTGGPTPTASASVTTTGSYGYVTCTIPASQPTRSGYVFGGWATNADGTGTIRYPGGTCTFASSSKTSPGTAYMLYAVWTKEPDGGAYIWTDGARKKATPYIWTDGAWKKATPYIHSGTAWKKGV